MFKQVIRHILTLIALAVASATFARAQSPALPVNNPWQIAQSAASSRKQLSLVTFDQPDRRRTCHVQSFTADKLVCSRGFGAARTYLPQQVLALILPGDDHAKLRFVLVLNAAMGAAIWGTVVLTATCPACAVATGIAALLFFGAAGAVLIADDTPDKLVYLAPGRVLTGKLSIIRPA